MSCESGWDRHGVGWGDEVHDDEGHHQEYWNPDSASASAAADAELDRLLAEVPPHHDGPGPDQFGG